MDSAFRDLLDFIYSLEDIAPEDRTTFERQLLAMARSADPSK